MNTTNLVDSPNVLLADMLNACSMSQKELAARTSVTEKHICTVLSSERSISIAFARKLSYVFPTINWVNKVAEYEDYQLKLQEENSISEEEKGLLKPLKEIMFYFIEKGWMHNNCGDSEKIMQLRSLLNVSDLLSIPKITYNAAYKAQISKNIKVNPFVLFAWQRMCELEAEPLYKNVTNLLNTNLLKERIDDIKKAMFGKISEGIHELQEIFADCGIVFHVAKNFRGAPVQGFIKKILNEKLLLCLTIRRKRADTFWFTLFHEIGHIINGDYTARFVDFETIDSICESKADTYARNTLIDPLLYKSFIQRTEKFTWSAIEEFSKECNIQSFIVLGRLQKDEFLEWTDYPNKIVTYKWA